jgi:hypothetical protein
MVGIELDPCAMGYIVVRLDESKPALVNTISFSGLNPHPGLTGVPEMREMYRNVDPRLGTFFEVINCVLIPFYDDIFHYGVPIIY